jgi:hypothetical protein
MDSYNNETIFSNIKDSTNYIIENHHKFLLLLFVFVIIYFVEYITHINTLLYSSAPLIPGLNSQKPQLKPQLKPKGKRNKSIRR